MSGIISPMGRRRGTMMSSLGEAHPSTEAGPASSEQTGNQSRVRDDGPWLLVLTVQGAPDPALPPMPENSAVRPITHRLEALGFLRARIGGTSGAELLEVVECRAGGLEGMPEAELLVGFWRSFETWRPRLVTFGGRGYGVPLLKYSSMRHLMTARHLHEAGDKWSGYGHRYAQTHHVDVMDTLADFHAAPFPSLAEVAEALGLPHRPVTEGGGPRVRAECDAATIFLAYARWRLLTGQMSLEGHAAAEASLRRVLEGQTRSRPHLAALAR